MPAILKWTGTLPPGIISDLFVLSTDLFPTFLDAASIAQPRSMQLDGLSLLPRLVPGYHEARRSSSADRILIDHLVRDRVGLWHNDFEGNRSSAAWMYNYKLILDRNDAISEMYDMASDIYEQRNLWTSSSSYGVGSSLGHVYSVESILFDRANVSIHTYIAHRAHQLLLYYIHSGDMAYRQLMSQHPAWRYRPTALSNHRAHIYDQEPILREEDGPWTDPNNDVHRLVNETIASCRAVVHDNSCSCKGGTSSDRSSDVYVLRFDLMEAQYQYTTPERLNASRVLFLSG